MKKRKGYMKKYDLEDTDENIKLTIEKNNLNRNKKIITRKLY